ncbi:MAG: sulfatase-like hydrolase/transferase [Polyangiaceae bacterium]
MLRLPFRLRLAAAPLVGALLLAIANAADIVATVRWPPGGATVRASHHAFDAMETLGVGLVAALLLGSLGRALRHRPALAKLTFFAIGAALSFLVLGQDLHHQADFLVPGAASPLAFAAFVLACGAALPLAYAIGTRASRGRILPWIALALACGGMVTSHLLVRDDYAGLHAAIDSVSATLAFAALARPVAHLLARRRGRLAIAALALAGAAGIAVSPSNRTRLELFRAPGAIGAWAMAHTVWPPPAAVEGENEAPLAKPPAEPVPPSRDRLIHGAPVVVMITIDATRADAVLDPKNAAALPFMTELRRTAATFTRAISPGSQTSVSLTTMFSGRYFSQLYWARHGHGSSRFLYAAEDDAPRFPEILTAHGVKTVMFGGTGFLANQYGVARGFEETKVPEGRRHATANELIDPLISRLNRVGREPTFLYVHLMEPHAPYDRGKRHGTEFERYLSEIGVADAQVARVARVLAQRFPSRAVLIVSADHGEAFGEHGTRQHTKTLYDELLRVPLFIRAGRVPARLIDTRVTLADIGPTVLDLFGLDTPPTFMGQSLVPLLKGHPTDLTRPVVAEGRLRRALYFGDVKVIEDLRRKVVEAYDLTRDPDELDNLFDTADPRAPRALGALRSFFEANALRRPGYSPPYKP